MKAIISPTDGATSTLSLQRRTSISVWTKSCLLIFFWVVSSHITSSWNAQAEEITQSDTNQDSKLTPEAPANVAQPEPEAPDSTLNVFSTKSSPKTVSSDPTSNPKQTPATSTPKPISDKAPSNTQSSLTEVQSDQAPELSKIPRRPSKNLQRQFRAPSAIERADSSTGKPSAAIATKTATPKSTQIRHFKVDGSSLPASQFKLQNPEIAPYSNLPQQDWRTRPLPPSLETLTIPNRSSPRARLLIRNLRNISTRTTQNRAFHNFSSPIKQPRRVPRTRQTAWQLRKQLASPQGKPTNGFVFISSLFGKRRNPFGRGVEFHNGVDLVGAKGIPILATAKGRVITRKRNRGYGVHVILKHDLGYETLYAHLSKALVKPNQVVRRGDIVGFLGSTGRSTGPHLHYSVYLNRQAVDPKPYLFK